jgi:hypothetical protein
VDLASAAIASLETTDTRSVPGSFCDGGHYTSCGSPTGCALAYAELNSDDDSHPVICCADTRIDASFTKTCSSAYSSSTIDGSCFNSMTFDEAFEVCADIG